MSEFEKMFWSKKILFWFFLLRENDIFCIFRAFLKSMRLNWNFHYVSDFDLKKIQRVRFWIWQENNASEFELKIILVRLWINFLNTRQISNWNFYGVSGF